MVGLLCMVLLWIQGVADIIEKVRAERVVLISTVNGPCHAIRPRCGHEESLCVGSVWI